MSETIRNSDILPSQPGRETAADDDSTFSPDVEDFPSEDDTLEQGTDTSAEETSTETSEDDGDGADVSSGESAPEPTLFDLFRDYVAELGIDIEKADPHQRHHIARAAHAFVRSQTDPKKLFDLDPKRADSRATSWRVERSLKNYYDTFPAYKDDATIRARRQHYLAEHFKIVRQEHLVTNYPEISTAVELQSLLHKQGATQAGVAIIELVAAYANRLVGTRGIPPIIPYDI